MAEAYLEYPSRGVGPYPIHALPYLLADHLVVTVNGTPVAATVDDGARTVTLAAAAASGTLVRIARVTPKDEDDRLTQFLDLASGSAGLTADLLDQDYRQNLYVLGEARDQTAGLDPSDGMGIGASGHWDGEALRIENLAVGSSPADLITKAQLDSADTVTSNLPSVSGSDNDSGLFVSGGAWAARTPTQARAHLGLGSVATLIAGVGANNVPQLDSSARWPAADGRNIDLANHPLLALRATATVVRWHQSGLGSAGVDPRVATWSQALATRINISGGWSSRVELNNSGAVDGSSISPYRIRLTAGTWRIKWAFRPRFSSTTNDFTSFRVTNNDDTSAQIVYFDLGPHQSNLDASGNDFTIFADSIILTLASTDAVVFRFTNFNSGGSNTCDLSVFFHKIK